MKRVGVDVASVDRWNSVGESYARHIDDAYHQHRLSVIKSLLPDLHGKLVIDFGCGEGVLIRSAIAAGAREVIGIDIDQRLLDIAGDAGASRLLRGSVEQMATIERADCIIAANVAAYFTDDEDRRFYEEVKRILIPGGALVITHSNSLFDLFTLNAYTVSFFRENFAADISSLLRYPNKPARLSFNIRENPLHYPYKLKCYGLSLEQMEFMNLHGAPPLLTLEDPDDMTRERPDTLNVPEWERWKLMLQCSMFGVRAITNCS